MEQGILATVVTNSDELKQIAALSQANSIHLLNQEQKDKEGFVTWSYNEEILEKLHKIAPGIIVKDGGVVAGYALVLTKDAAAVYPPFQAMLDNLAQVTYEGKPINDYRYYVMGQVCVHPDYRGKGIFRLLYQHHKTLFAQQYELLVTEISVANLRSQRAHQKIGFKTVHTYDDDMGRWDVVVWDLKQPS